MLPTEFEFSNISLHFLQNVLSNHLDKNKLTLLVSNFKLLSYNFTKFKISFQKFRKYLDADNLESFHFWRPIYQPPPPPNFTLYPQLCQFHFLLFKRTIFGLRLDLGTRGLKFVSRTNLKSEP